VASLAVSYLKVETTGSTRIHRSLGQEAVTFSATSSGAVMIAACPSREDGDPGVRQGVADLLGRLAPGRRRKA
jgi:hypothetical protein